MKNLKVLLLSSLIIVINFASVVAKNHQMVSKNHSAKSFSSIITNTTADIVYTQSDVVSVRVNGVAEMIDQIQIDVNDGALTILDNLQFDNETNSPVVIFISSPSIESVETYGKGNFYMKDRVKVNNLYIRSKGAGNIQASDLESKKMSIKYGGIGNIKLGGKTEVIDIYSEGTGNIDCENLMAKTVIVKSTNMGNVNCYASQSIGIFNYGVGEVTYYGNPTFKKLQNSNVGNILAVK